MWLEKEGIAKVEGPNGDGNSGPIDVQCLIKCLLYSAAHDPLCGVPGLGRLRYCSKSRVTGYPAFIHARLHRWEKSCPPRILHVAGKQ
jgi:hypothetical protein